MFRFSNLFRLFSGLFDFGCGFGLLINWFEIFLMTDWHCGQLQVVFRFPGFLFLILFLFFRFFSVIFCFFKVGGSCSLLVLWGCGAKAAFDGLQKRYFM